MDGNILVLVAVAAIVIAILIGSNKKKGGSVVVLTGTSSKTSRGWNGSPNLFILLYLALNAAIAYLSSQQCIPLLRNTDDELVAFFAIQVAIFIVALLIVKPRNEKGYGLYFLAALAIAFVMNALGINACVAH